MKTEKSRLRAVLEATRLWPHSMPAAVKDGILDAEVDAMLEPEIEPETPRDKLGLDDDGETESPDARTQREQEREAQRRAAWNFLLRKPPQP